MHKARIWTKYESAQSRIALRITTECERASAHNTDWW
jgi:hypothetical protein